MRQTLLLPALFLAFVAQAQQTLPPGTYLPIELHGQITAGRTPAGTLLHARTTQRIPLPGQPSLPRNTEVTGSVLVSTPTTLVLTFTSVTHDGRTIPIQTTARALATFVAVSDSAAPCSGAMDHANSSPANWTTCQIGDDEVVRSGWVGPLIDASTQTIGHADYDGVYLDPSTPGAAPLALGVFSANALGLFGYGKGTALASTAGTITLSTAKRLTLHPADHLLLECHAAPATHTR